MEALQRLHMSPVGSPFGMNHHESMLRANANVASHDDRKSPMDTRLIMQVSKIHFLLGFIYLFTNILFSQEETKYLSCNIRFNFLLKL